ncbi:MAG: YqcI/YcgG family protein, partial [Pseudomonadota bacterium]
DLQSAEQHYIMDPQSIAGLQYHCRDTLAQTLPEQGWQEKCWQIWCDMMNSKARPFPCYFGVQGFRTNQLRYTFMEQIDAGGLAPILRSYLGGAREFGPNTSLVVFSRPEPTRSIEEYRTRFWSVLQQLHQCDETAWPDHIPQSLHDPKWEFCFAGEPIFVVCNTPAHTMRLSRYANSFMMTFQPRWVLDLVFRTKARAQLATSTVRKRLHAYDFLTPSPALGMYGDPESREFRQYFLEEDNETVTRCPFRSLHTPKDSNAAMKEHAA